MVRPRPRSRPATSQVLKRLVGFTAKNRFDSANRDLGRISKTEFILQYLSERELAGIASVACVNANVDLAKRQEQHQILLTSSLTRRR